MTLRGPSGGRTAEDRWRPWDRLRGHGQPGDTGAGKRTSLLSRRHQHRARIKDQSTSLGASRHPRGRGGHRPPHSTPDNARDDRHEPALFPCGRSACHRETPARQRCVASRSAPGENARQCLEQAQLLRRRPGCRACLGRRGGTRRRGGRLRGGLRRGHRRRYGLRLGRGLGLLPLANARGDRLLDRGGAAWGRP
jgi:hypothetical protein